MGIAGPARQARKRLGRKLLDLLFPPLCVVCRKPIAAAHNLCGECWRGIAFIEQPFCDLCGFPFEFDVTIETLCAACLKRAPAFDRARALMRYDDASRDLVLAFKRADRLDLVPPFARWLLRVGREIVTEADLIVPVPLHPWRLWGRRFNQSALLAQCLGRLSAKPVECLALIRTRPTPSQGEMPSARARRRNVQGAFRIDPARREAVNGRAILLVDDVFTTGATLEACARALKRGGARQVFVLTLARVVRALTPAI
jgi:ComF family protein